MSVWEILTGPVIALLALGGLVWVSSPGDRAWVAVYSLKVLAVGLSLFGLAIVAGWL